jgi:hypothetical protein
VLAVYGLWLSRLVWGHVDPRDYIVLGRHWVRLSHASSVIKYDPPTIIIMSSMATTGSSITS